MAPNQKSSAHATRPSIHRVKIIARSSPHTHQELTQQDPPRRQRVKISTSRRRSKYPNTDVGKTALVLNRKTVQSQRQPPIQQKVGPTKKQVIPKRFAYSTKDILSKRGFQPKDYSNTDLAYKSARAAREASGEAGARQRSETARKTVMQKYKNSTLEQRREWTRAAREASEAAASRRRREDKTGYTLYHTRGRRQVQACKEQTVKSAADSEGRAGVATTQSG